MPFWAGRGSHVQLSSFPAAPHHHEKLSPSPAYRVSQILSPRECEWQDGHGESDLGSGGAALCLLEIQTFLIDAGRAAQLLHVLVDTQTLRHTHITFEAMPL